MGVKANIDLCIYMILYHINVKSLEDMNNHISGGKHHTVLRSKYMIKNINLRSCLKPDAQRLHKIYF